MEYRKEIDGLRAVAVTAVILYHAHVSALKGGFVGVDVFFVISGFLITSVILDQQAKGRFTIRGFYERRARRILPALLVVLLASTVAVWFILPPWSMRDFAESVLSVLGFSSNFFFWKTSGYFAPSADAMPLIHTWSLGVEEQFYLLFPLLIVACVRLGRHATFAVVSVAAILSFGFAVWLVAESPDAAFYISPARFWESLLGALLAFSDLRTVVPERWRSVANNTASLLGLCLIAVACFVYDSKTPFPSLYALAPTLGAALVIGFASPKTLVARFLSLSPLVGLGLISYSAYLWHQPLFVLARVAQSLDGLSWLNYAALCATTVLLSYVSWRYVEQPFRRKVTIGKRIGYEVPGKKVLLAAMVAIVALIAAACMPLIDGSFQGRSKFSERTIRSLQYETRCAQLTTTCLVNPSSAAAPSFLVWGDSHAQMMLPAFEAVAQRRGLQGAFYTQPACVPLLGLASNMFDLRNGIASCPANNRKIVDIARSLGIHDVFLVGNWSVYTEYGYSGKSPEFISLTSEGPRTVEASRAAFAAAVALTAATYDSIGIRVHFVGHTPLQTYEISNLYYHLSFRADKESEIRRLSVSEAMDRTHESFVRSVLQQVKLGAGITVTDLGEAFCGDGVCRAGTAEEAYYWDTNHLTTVGALATVNVLERAFGPGLVPK